MEKLELKHLAPYLPYGLNIQYLGTETVELIGFNKNTIYHTTGFFVELPCNIKPILRRLSDLIKEIDWDNNNDPYMIGYKYGIQKVQEDGVDFYAEEYDADYCDSPRCYINITSFNWWLFEWHFDVFGLIEHGLAIDINTLENN